MTTQVKKRIISLLILVLSVYFAAGSVFFDKSSYFYYRQLDGAIATIPPFMREETISFATYRRDSSFARTVGIDGSYLFTSGKELTNEEIYVRGEPLHSNIVFGSIDITSAISRDGARLYNVPIGTVCGLKMTPQVALQYNSQSGEGICGYGWNLAGLSSITLINNSQYYYGSSDAASIYRPSASSAFALDGVPLVENSGDLSNNYPLVTATGNVLVRANLRGNYVNTFTVLFPDGRRGTYGVSNPSLMQNDAVYPIVSQTDRDGNRISYSYLEKSDSLTGGNYLVSKISYGYKPHPQQPAYHASITFNYARNDSSICRYYAGEVHTNKLRLSTIDSKQGDSTLFAYNLSYEFSAGVHLLKKLDCTNGSSSKMKPLFFHYFCDFHSGEDAFMIDTVLLSRSFGPGSQLILQRGHFRSTSASDGLLFLPRKSTYANLSGESTPKQYGSQYNPNQQILCYPQMRHSTSNIVDSLSAGSDFQGMFVADIDGNGIDELVRLNYMGTSGSSTLLQVTKYALNGDDNFIQIGSFTVPVSGRLYGSGFITGPLWRYFSIGNFLGDGRVQLLSISYDGSPDGVYSYTSRYDLIDLQLGTIISSNVNPFSLSASDRPPVAFDIDGDGRTELLRHCNPTLVIYSFGPNNTLLQDMSFTTGPSNARLEDILYADFNGDGYVDIACPPMESKWITYIDDETGLEEEQFIDSGSTWTFFEYTGNTFVISSKDIVRNYEGYTFYAADVDGDGLSDIVSERSSSVYWNRNGYFSQSDCTLIPQLNSSSKVISINYGHYDRTGILACLQGSVLRTYGYQADRGDARLLTEMTDSYGKKEITDYQQLLPGLSGAQYSVTGCQCPEGYARVYGRMHIVTRTSQYQSTLDTTLLEDKSFLWYDAVHHRTGLGFCGYMNTTMIDRVHNTIRTTSNAPNILGLHLQESVYQGGEVVSYRTWEFDANDLPLRRINPRLTRSTTRDYQSDIRTVTTFSYDSYGYPVRSQSTNYTGSGSTFYINSDTIVYHHRLTDTLYCLGTPVTSIERHEADDNIDTWWSHKVVYSYDGHLHPVMQENYIGITTATGEPENLVSRTSRTFDVRGNITFEGTAPYDATIFTGTHIAYDADKLFPLSETDPLGHTRTYGMYSRYGKPFSVTDHKGHTTLFEYGEWGMLQRTKYPDGSWKEKVTNWDGDGFWKTTMTSSCTPVRIVRYDAVGREVSNGQQDPFGRWIYSEIEYDKKGRVSRRSHPYFDEDTTRLWSYVFYDNLDRPIRVLEPSGREHLWNYSGLSVTETIDSISTTVTKDAIGRTISLADAGGTVTYSLRDDGQPVRIMAQGGSVTTISYDEYGRRVGLNDPAVGLRSTSYNNNADGSWDKLESGPNGSILSYYDRFGRITGAEHDNLLMWYTYNSDGLLAEHYTEYGNETDYTYDSFGRIVSEQIFTGGTRSFRKEYSYNNIGRLAATTYSEMGGVGYICTENYNYAFGHLKEIALSDGRLVWGLRNSNSLGNPTEIGSGYGIHYMDYNANGYPTWWLMESNSGGTTAEWSYGFNPFTGNLCSRTDLLASEQENFNYDNLGRLVSINDRCIRYDTYSNILSIGGVGTLSYSLGNPYLLNGFSPVSTDITSSFGTLQVTYNPADRPVILSGRGFTADIDYNSLDERASMVLRQRDSIILRRDYYGRQYETEDRPNNTIRCLFLGGDAYSAPAVLVKDGAGSWDFYTIGRDYLGSIICIADYEAEPVREYAYDAWGSETTGTDLLLGRGYCGHEYLPWFRVLNMNARLYDPVLGRFLSPDAYVQNLGFTPGRNRYSYALSNPLKYIDPNGEFAITTAIIVGVAIGATIGALTGVAIAENKGVSGWTYAGYVLGGFAIGGLSAFLGGCAGEAIASSIAIGGFAGGAITGGVGGAIGGAANGFGMTWMSTGSFLDAVFGGANGFVLGAASGAALGGITGGISAKLQGGDFWTGRMPEVSLGTESISEMQAQPLINQEHGRIGEQRAYDMLVEQGFEDPKSQVTIISENTKVRVDWVTEYNDRPVLVEVKTGPTARFTPNQKIVYPRMMEGMPIPTAHVDDNISSLLSTQNPFHTTSFSYVGQKPIPMLTRYGETQQYYFLVIRF